MDWTTHQGRIYSTDETSDVIAEATLAPHADGVVNITHTYVSPALRGRGVASQMMRAVMDHLRKSGLKAVATCSYAHMWLRRHADAYADVISGDIDGQNTACRIDGRH